MMNLKRKTCTGIVFMLFFLGIMSCSKTELNPTNKANPEKDVSTINGLAKRSWGANYHWKIGSDWRCYNLGDNCFDEIIIKAMVLQDLDSAINTGSSGVKSFFSDKSRWDLVFPDLDKGANQAFLTKLQSGNFTMTKRVHGTRVLYEAVGGVSPVETFAFQCILK